MLTRGWWLALGAGSLILVLTILPPFVGEGVRPWLMQAFSFVCHQLPGRSPHVDGVQLAVCHRCFGIYWGLPLAALVYPWLRRGIGSRRKYAPWILGASLLPILVDWAGDVAGVFTNSPVSRMVTGVAFGLVAGYFFVSAMIDAGTPKPPATK